MSDVTRILSQIESGDPSAADQLLPLVYDELRILAAAKLANEKPGQTLQATALVHEAYLRLVGGGKEQDWNSRGHFFGAAAEAMRRILIGHARRRRAQRRGDGVLNLNLDGLEVSAPLDDESVLAVNEALEKFSAVDPQKAELVKLRYFAGLTIEDAASTLSISNATAKRWWAFARAWLHRELAA
jgi:RNA polymerase sigma factor (TIGR02999 family)